MNREFCVYDKTKINVIKTIKNFPVYCGQSEETQYDTLDLSFGISNNGTIQTTSLVPLEILYKHSHNDAIGNTWEQHFKSLSSFISPHIHNKNIFEFGGGTCKTFFMVEGLVSKWTTLDFNPIHDTHKKLNSIKGSVVDSFDPSYDVYFSSHFLEHLYEPYEFLSNLSSCKIGTKHIFSIPKQLEWMELGYANSLFFEHTVVLETSKLIEEHKKIGYVLVDSCEYKDHSSFYCFEKVSEEIESSIAINSFEKNNKILEEYIKKLKGGYEINSNFYIFSAHIQSQYILKLNEYSNFCIGVLDNSPLKIGKRLYGFGLKIISPIEGNKNITVLVPNSPYSSEIKSQLFSLGYKDVI